MNYRRFIVAITTIYLVVGLLGMPGYAQQQEQQQKPPILYPTIRETIQSLIELRRVLIDPQQYQRLCGDGSHPHYDEESGVYAGACDPRRHCAVCYELKNYVEENLEDDDGRTVSLQWGCTMVDSGDRLEWVDYLHFINVESIAGAVSVLEHEKGVNTTQLALFYAPDLFPQYNYLQLMRLLTHMAYITHTAKLNTTVARSNNCTPLSTPSDQFFRVHSLTGTHADLCFTEEELSQLRSASIQITLYDAYYPPRTINDLGAKALLYMSYLNRGFQTDLSLMEDLPEEKATSVLNASARRYHHHNLNTSASEADSQLIGARCSFEGFVAMMRTLFRIMLEDGALEILAPDVNYRNGANSQQAQQHPHASGAAPTSSSSTGATAGGTTTAAATTPAATGGGCSTGEGMDVGMLLDSCRTATTNVWEATDREEQLSILRRFLFQHTGMDERSPFEQLERYQSICWSIRRREHRLAHALFSASQLVKYRLYQGSSASGLELIPNDGLPVVRGNLSGDSDDEYEDEDEDNISSDTAGNDTKGRKKREKKPHPATGFHEAAKPRAHPAGFYNLDAVPLMTRPIVSQSVPSTAGMTEAEMEMIQRMVKFILHGAVPDGPSNPPPEDDDMDEEESSPPYIPLRFMETAPAIPGAPPPPILEQQLPQSNGGSAAPSPADSFSEDATRRSLSQETPPLFVFSPYQGSRPYFFPQRLLRLRRLHHLPHPFDTQKVEMLSKEEVDECVLSLPPGAETYGVPLHPRLYTTHYNYFTASYMREGGDGVAGTATGGGGASLLSSTGHGVMMVEGPTGAWSAMSILLEDAAESHRPEEVSGRLERHHVYAWERDAWRQQQYAKRMDACIKTFQGQQHHRNGQGGEVKALSNHERIHHCQREMLRDVLRDYQGNSSTATMNASPLRQFFEQDASVNVDSTQLAENAPLDINFFLRIPREVVLHEIIDPLRERVALLRHTLQAEVTEHAIMYSPHGLQLEVMMANTSLCAHLAARWLERMYSEKQNFYYFSFFRGVEEVPLYLNHASPQALYGQRGDGLTLSLQHELPFFHPLVGGGWGEVRHGDHPRVLRFSSSSKKGEGDDDAAIRSSSSNEEWGQYRGTPLPYLQTVSSTLLHEMMDESSNSAHFRPLEVDREARRRAWKAALTAYLLDNRTAFKYFLTHTRNVQRVMLFRRLRGIARLSRDARKVQLSPHPLDYHLTFFDDIIEATVRNTYHSFYWFELLAQKRVQQQEQQRLLSLLLERQRQEEEEAAMAAAAAAVGGSVGDGPLLLSCPQSRLRQPLYSLVLHHYPECTPLTAAELGDDLLPPVAMSGSLGVESEEGSRDGSSKATGEGEPSGRSWENVALWGDGEAGEALQRRVEELSNFFSRKRG